MVEVIRSSGAGPVRAWRLPFRAAPLLSSDEERQLARLSAAGDAAAAERLVLSHLRMVARMARRYATLGLPTSDLIQEGTIGLIQAVRRFNPDRGVRLSTYAAWWVRASIQEHVVRSWSLVRLGKTAAHRALFLRLKPLAEPRTDPAEALGEATAGRLARHFNLPIGEVAAMIRRLAAHDASLNQPLTDGADGDSYLDRLAADQPLPEDIVADRRLTARWGGLIERALAMLPAREAMIIRRRHLDETAPTFETIGRELGISKDRVRQLERRALDRLKALLHPAAAALGLPGS